MREILRALVEHIRSTGYKVSYYDNNDCAKIEYNSQHWCVDIGYNPENDTFLSVEWYPLWADCPTLDYEVHRSSLDLSDPLLFEKLDNLLVG